MKSKTLAAIAYYEKLIKEQGEDMSTDPTMGQAPPPDPSQDVTENPAPTPDETAPLTSEGENKLIEAVVNAALFVPSPEQATELENYQNVMQLKRFTNARDEVLNPVLGIISNVPQDASIKQSINRIS